MYAIKASAIRQHLREGETAEHDGLIHQLLDNRTGFRGEGYLAGDYPDGITSVDGIPVAAIIRVHLRSVHPNEDGLVVAQVESAPDGTWRIDGLNTSLKFDVIGRKNGFNDVIVANVTPEID